MAAIGDINLTPKPKNTYEVSSNSTLNLLESIRKFS